MKRKVLIVEDNEINRDMLCKILSGEYNVLLAENGQEAIEELKKFANSVSAVLLDLKMPVMDGYEVLRIMKDTREFSQIPVIVITEDSETKSQIRALSLGANDVTVKPYNGDIIRYRLKNLINIRETAIQVNAARIDELTGLLNRGAFFESVAQLTGARGAGYYVMASVDVDNFKMINDKYSNAEGDRILRAIGDIFKQGFERVGGICCRTAEDDFALLYPKPFMDTQEMRDIFCAAQTPLSSILSLSFSVGQYVIDDLSLSPSAMYDRAIIAQKSIKGRFDTHIALYDESMRKALMRRQLIVSEMKAALQSNQFEVWFQPQYDHSVGSLIGAEALVRWRHLESGIIYPSDFIPEFEQNGFIYELDKYVWRRTCRVLCDCLDAKIAPLPVSVNVSRYDIFRNDFLDTLKGFVKEFEIPISLLRLEITESAFVSSTNQIIGAVKELIANGFIVEIDDFGSGYSSLNILKDVPAQILKLDMRFLDDNEDTTRGTTIIESVTAMAKRLGMSVIAEGVETCEQADFLQSAGCNFIQGYFYSKPICERDYIALLKKR